VIDSVDWPNVVTAHIFQEDLLYSSDPNAGRYILELGVWDDDGAVWLSAGADRSEWIILHEGDSVERAHAEVADIMRLHAYRPLTDWDTVLPAPNDDDQRTVHRCEFERRGDVPWPTLDYTPVFDATEPLTVTITAEDIEQTLPRN
jgi:hypothetical protein